VKIEVNPLTDERYFLR